MILTGIMTMVKAYRIDMIGKMGDEVPVIQSILPRLLEGRSKGKA
jgi:hypothetical protein